MHADGTGVARHHRQVVEQCDHLIDMHGGDIDESLRATRTGR